MRKRFWRWFVQKMGYEVGRVLPAWGVAVFALLFPLRWFKWQPSRRWCEYDLASDSWVIDGVCISRLSLLELIHSNDKWFRIVDTGPGGTIYIEREEQE